MHFYSGAPMHFLSGVDRRKRSIIPIAFWYFSLAGGMTLLIYATHRRDPVFITGQALVVDGGTTLPDPRYRRAPIPLNNLSRSDKG